MLRCQSSATIRVLTVLRHSAGGVRTYLKYTYKHLDSSKYSFKLITVKAEEVEQLKADLNCLSTEFVEVSGFDLVFVWNLLKLLWGRNIDVIHSQGYSCGLLVSFLNLAFSLPHIITLHGTFDDTTLMRPFVPFKKFVMLFLLSRADVVNVVSRDAESNFNEYFGRLKVAPSKIVVIENGIDVEFFGREIELPHKLTDIDGIDQETIVIGYLGRFMPEKGFPVLIDAMGMLAKLPNAGKPFKVLALGWGAFIREYQASIRERGLNQFFVFTDFQSDVRWILKQVDMLVIPSLREAFPLLAAEALVCGTPIIGSNCIGLREVLKGSPARLVAPGDAKELAQAIVDMSRISRRKEAREFVPIAIKRFDASVAAARLDLIFESLHNNSGRRN